MKFSKHAIRERIRRFRFIRRIPGSTLLAIIFYLLELKKERLSNILIKRLREKGGGDFWGSSGLTATALLYLMVRIMKPLILIETGVSSGSSSWFILHALEKNGCGTLYSVDIERSVSLGDGSIVYKGWIVPHGIDKRWKFKIGESKSILPFVLKEVKEIDIFFHDSDHSYENMIREFNICWEYIRKRGCLVSHDIDLNNAFFDFARKKNKRPFIYRNFGMIIK